MADIAAYFSGPSCSQVRTHQCAGRPGRRCRLRRLPWRHGYQRDSELSILAGQHADYLKREIAEYKTGGRKIPSWPECPRPSKDSDVDALADYFSKMQPALGTSTGRSSILSAGR